MPIRIARTVLAASLAASLAAGALVLPVIAQDEAPPQVARQELMEQNGDMAGVVGDMLRGERPYDGAEATEALDTIIADLEEFITLFPEDSMSGHETRALPVIWEDWDGFVAVNDEAIAAAQAVRAVAADGLDAIRPTFGALGNSCRDCHEQYRAERQ